MSNILQLHSTTDDVTGVVEHTAYLVFIPTGTSDTWDIAYSALVPSGETRQIHITDSYVRLNPNSSGVLQGGADLLLESPATSNTWKINVGHAEAVQPMNRATFSPGLIMSSGDEFCFTAWSGNTDTASVVQASLKYTIA